MQFAVGEQHLKIFLRYFMNSLVYNGHILVHMYICHRRLKAVSFFVTCSVLNVHMHMLKACLVAHVSSLHLQSGAIITWDH